MTAPTMPLSSGLLKWGQEQKYSAAQDRAVIYALTAGATGLVRPAALNPGGTGLLSVAAGWVAVVDCGDGTSAVASSDEETVVSVAGYPPGSYTLWITPNPAEGTWTLTLEDDPGAIGFGGPLGTVGVPAPPSTTLTLSAAPVSFTAGALGPMGPAGPQGLPGPKGDTGATGPPGSAGTNPTFADVTLSAGGNTVKLEPAPPSIARLTPGGKLLTGASGGSERSGGTNSNAWVTLTPDYTWPGAEIQGNMILIVEAFGLGQVGPTVNHLEFRTGFNTGLAAYANTGTAQIAINEAFAWECQIRCQVRNAGNQVNILVRGSIWRQAASGYATPLPFARVARNVAYTPGSAITLNVQAHFTAAAATQVINCGSAHSAKIVN